MKLIKNRIFYRDFMNFLIYAVLLTALIGGSKANAYDYGDDVIPVLSGESLRAAIAAASDGDIIELTGDENGIFREAFVVNSPIVVDKSVKITSAGEPVDLCVYSQAAYGSGIPIFRIIAPDVTFENLAALRIGGNPGDTVGSSVNITAFIEVSPNAARFTLRDIGSITAMATSAANVTKTLVSVDGAPELSISGSAFNISAANSFGISFDGGAGRNDLMVANTSFSSETRAGITSISASNAGTLTISGCDFRSTAATARHIAGTGIGSTYISNGSTFTIANTGRVCDIAGGENFTMLDSAVNMNFKNTFGFTLTDLDRAVFSGNSISVPAGCTVAKAFEAVSTPSVIMNSNTFTLNAAGAVGARIDAGSAASLDVSMNGNTITAGSGTTSFPVYGVSVSAGFAESATLTSSDTVMNLGAVSKGIAAAGLTASSFTNDDAVFPAASNAAKGIELTGGANASFTACDFTMDGTKSEGISVYGTDGIAIINCNVDIVGGITSYPDIGIAIRADGGTLPRNLVIDGQNTAHIRCHSQSERTVGISIDAVDGAVIRNIAFDNNYQADGGTRKNYAAIPLRINDTSSNPAAPMINDVLVTGCVFDVSGIRGVGLSSGGLVVGTPPENGYSVKNLVVKGNTFSVRGQDGQSDNTTSSYRGDSDRCFGLNATRQDGFVFESNTVTVDGSFSKGFSLGQGILNKALSNTINGLNGGWIGIISDGIGTDNPGESAYRDDETLFDGNIFTGSFNTGMYISSNGNTISNNDLKGAVFQNAEISIAVCRDAHILSNSFAPTVSQTMPVIRLTESQIAETGNNIFYFSGPNAEYVLAIVGNAAVYIDNSIDEYSEVEYGNTINRIVPVETETPRSADNSVQYSYVLRLPKDVPDGGLPDENTPGEADMGEDIPDEEVPLDPPPEPDNGEGEIIDETPPTTEPDIPKTGDGSDHLAFVLLMTASAAVLICIEAKKNRNIGS